MFLLQHANDAEYPSSITRSHFANAFNTNASVQKRNKISNNIEATTTAAACGTVFRTFPTIPLGLSPLGTICDLLCSVDIIRQIKIS